MRRLAAEDAEASTQGSLTDLHNRHAVYREAVRHLVDQGWKGLAKTKTAGRLLNQADVEEYLAEIGNEKRTPSETPEVLGFVGTAKIAVLLEKSCPSRI